MYTLAIHNNQLLLIKKARGPYTGMFDMPGGRIEFGEEPEQTLVREVLEETHLRVTSSQILCSITIRFQHNFYEEPDDLHHIGIIYTITIDAPHATTYEGDGQDSSGTIWLPFDELLQHPVTPLTLKALSYVTTIHTKIRI